MSSWKCSNCGLVNFATVAACRRCQTSAAGGYATDHSPQENFQANNSAPPQNYQTGNLPTQFPPTSSNEHTQSGGYTPNQSYPQNDFAQSNAYPQSGNSEYVNNHPDEQNNGYQQSSGYAYNQGDTNGLNTPSQPFTNYQQSNYSQSNYSQADYSQAPSYGAPSVGAYQPSYSAGYGAQGAGVWREGDKLVMHKLAMLPDRCVKCNASTNRGYLGRNLTWLPSAWLLLFFLGLLGWIAYAILSSTVRKKAHVELGLCEPHRANRRTGITIGWVTALLGIGCFVLAGANEQPGFFFLGLLLFLGGIIFGSYAANVVSVTKMDDHYIWMKRVNKDYLSSFPPTGGY